MAHNHIIHDYWERMETLLPYIYTHKYLYSTACIHTYLRKITPFTPLLLMKVLATTRLGSPHPDTTYIYIQGHRRIFSNRYSRSCGGVLIGGRRRPHPGNVCIHFLLLAPLETLPTVPWPIVREQGSIVSIIYHPMRIWRTYIHTCKLLQRWHTWCIHT